MDFALSEEQKMLQTMARDFLEKECPKSLVREMEADATGHSPELWKKMAELGWQGLCIPEVYGGGGFSFLDLTVLLEEMGRACLPGPFFSTVVLGALTIADSENEELKKEILPKIASGEITLTLALTEPNGRWDAEGVQCSAKANGDSYILNGTKLFVPHAHVADWLIVAARTSNAGSPEDGITLFMVDAKSPSISTIVLETIASDKQCEVVLKDVEVPANNIMGNTGEGWLVIQKVLEYATVAKCAEMVGGAQQVLDMTVEYAKERVQFDKPIGSFQAVQHHCTNMAMDVDGSRFITYLAAWKLSEGLPSSKEVSIAKAWVSEAYRRVTKIGHQIHGGIGFTMDHDLQLYYRRAKTLASAFGNTDHHLKKVAAAV